MYLCTFLSVCTNLPSAYRFMYLFVSMDLCSASAYPHSTYPSTCLYIIDPCTSITGGCHQNIGHVSPRTCSLAISPSASICWFMGHPRSAVPPLTHARESRVEFCHSSPVLTQLAHLCGIFWHSSPVITQMCTCDSW